MSIIAIDPGTAHTGIVYMDERRIICCKTIAYKSTVKQDQYALKARAEAIAAQLSDWMADKPHECIVMEGFLGYTGKQGGYAFQTPYLCGYLHAALSGEEIVIQTSRQVLNPKTPGNVANLKSTTFAGLRNDHLRSAACHGAYFYARCCQ